MTQERMSEAAQILGELGNGKMANELVKTADEIDQLRADLAAMSEAYLNLPKLIAEECAKIADRHGIYHTGAASAARNIRIQFGLIKP